MQLVRLVPVLVLVLAPACKKKADWVKQAHQGSGSGSGSAVGSGSSGPTKPPLPAEGAVLTGAKSLGVGATRACAISSDTLWCWEPGKPAEEMKTPEMPFLVAGGECAALDKGDLWCWAPKEMRTPSNLATGGQVVVSGNEVCTGHRMDIKCWHLGDPTVQVAFEWPGVDKLDLGEGKLCSAVAGDTIECADITGKTAHAQPLDGPDNVAELAMSGNLSCSATTKGGVECWTNPKKRNTVAGVTGASDVAMGPSGYACAVGDGGAVTCWHLEANGSVTPNSVAQIGGVSGTQAIGVGDGYGCAIDGGSNVVCWGKASKDPATAQTVTKKG